ncbi:hypothetical protein E1301_Tti017072 [Triplophysa tibetana]|uniref:CUB domain-containing protein n=1 Tax=Triplophysa tibetana TaxID=1572043 RepID=A0A5A9MYS4_9TELE|nr:hypothetical protein E1301_Tti017072 [Triplophysa tibetana]
MQTCRFGSVVFFWGCFLSTVLDLTECAQINITVEKGITINLSASTTNSECKVCINQNCQSSAILKSNTVLDFSCSQPENVFVVRIFRGMVEYARRDRGSRPPGRKERHAVGESSPPRDLAVPESSGSADEGRPPVAARSGGSGETEVQVVATVKASVERRPVLPRPWVEIQQTDSCPDKHMYTFISLKDIVGRFCQNGSIRHIVLCNPGTLSLHVYGGQRLDKKVIIVSVKKTMNSLAEIIVDFNEKSKLLDFFSPNYPDGFPSKTKMLWSFNVPPSYYTSVSLLSYTLPTCLNPHDIPDIAYHWSEKKFAITRLRDSQPSMEPGSFSLSLRNCEISKKNTSQKGLMVHIQISVIKSPKEVSHDNRGITVGQFCPKGPIQNININKSKIDITVSRTATDDHCHLINPIINYLFRKEISEHYIFTVEAKSHYTALLATPAWPSGMTQSNTVSWIVMLDPQFKGKLEFKNVSQPKCKELCTSITVQSFRSMMMLYSTKEEDKIRDLQVLESFYLNMTNCKSISGDFKAMMQLTVQKSLRIPITQEDPHIYEYIVDTNVCSGLCNLNKQCTESSMDDRDPQQNWPPLPERAMGKGFTTNNHNMIDKELYG